MFWASQKDPRRLNSCFSQLGCGIDLVACKSADFTDISQAWPLTPPRAWESRRAIYRKRGKCRRGIRSNYNASSLGHTDSMSPTALGNLLTGLGRYFKLLPHHSTTLTTTIPDVRAGPSVYA